MNSNRPFDMKKVMKTVLYFALIFSCATTFAQSTISGTITNSDGIPLEQMPVYLSGDQTDVTLTDVNGSYEFTVPNDGNYIVEPRNNGGILKGISTLDLVIIDRHLSGIQLLDSPYDLIAADVNNDLLIEGSDTSELLLLILYQLPDFTNNTSWRFVQSGYTFPDPASPWPFPETYSITNIQNNNPGLDFIGVKVGDLNNSAPTVMESDPCDYYCGSFNGKVYFDENENCTISADEITLAGWLVIANDGTNIYHTTTNASGLYNLPIFAGTYEVSLIPPNDLWTACQLQFTETIEELENYNFDFQAQAVVDCPAMTIDMGAPRFRRCFENVYYIEYCNRGTATAENVSVEITFDSLIIINGSSIPWSSQVGNTYTFDVPDLPVNACGSFIVDFTTSCDAELGQTLCNEATVYPDTICIPPLGLWDGSNLEVTSQCLGDSVLFRVTNTGAPMTAPLGYIVIEDHMIMMVDNSDPIDLNTAEYIDFKFPANGSTWRIEVEQTADHPYSNLVSGAIEGCGINGTGTFSIGFMNQFPQLTSTPNMIIDCHEVVGSFDPNDKAAVPEGFGENNFIEVNTDLDYRIRFQNTGTDTAFTVIIRDTLDAALDITSIQPGAASHTYRFDLRDENVVEFYFPNIMLPDSNINEAGSHGFVNFKIAQMVDNPLETVIENSAAIYFDFNEPVITNTVFHTIGEDFLDILDAIPTLDFPTAALKVFPNPMHQTATIQVQGIEISEGTFILYDIHGRRLKDQAFGGNQIEFHREQLTNGLYLFEILEAGKLVSTGKLMIH